MNVTPTAGIAAAWSAAKSSPADRAAQQASSHAKAGKTEDTPAEAKKDPPPVEGQGTRVDRRV
jgi:hypothetical protein